MKGILAKLGRGFMAIGSYFAGGGDGRYQWAGGDWSGMVGRATVSGELVGPNSAMALPVYYACLRNLSEDAAKLPIAVYKRVGKGREEAVEHPSNDLLQRPSDYISGQQLREQLVAWALGWGHGEAIIRRESGRPVRLDLVHPSTVMRMKTEGGDIFFRIHDERGRPKDYGFDDVITIEGFQRISIASAMAENLGLNLAAQTFASAYYGNGFGASLAVELPGALTPETGRVARASWEEMHRGAARAHTPFFTGKGTIIKPMAVPANEAQFLESRQFGAEQIATAFRMPTQKLGILKQAAGWSTVEGLETAYVTDTLMPWNVKLENEFARKLLFPSEQRSHYVRVTVQGLLRGDVTARMLYYKEMHAMGKSFNEILALEDMNPVEGGDQRFRSTNLVPLSGPEPEAEPVEPPPAPTPEDPDAGPEAMRRRAILSHTKILAGQFAHAIKRETKSVGEAMNRKPDKFAAWADDYFRECDGYLADMVTPAAESLAMLAGGDASCVTPFITGYCLTSAQEAKAAYTAGAIPALVTQWTVSKASNESAKLVEMIVGKESSHDL